MSNHNNVDEYINEEVSRIKRRKTASKELLSWLLYIGIILVVTILINTFIGQRTRVDGNSMLPQLQNGDNLIVDKISYRFTDPTRFDIIVFPYQYKNNTFYIKRIMGLPGETIQIIDGRFFVNGEQIEDRFGNAQMNNPGIAGVPITLGENQYFVLGDNRNNSQDSRDQHVGVLERADILGRAWLRIWPLSSFGVMQHE